MPSVKKLNAHVYSVGNAIDMEDAFAGLGDESIIIGNVDPAGVISFAGGMTWSTLDSSYNSNSSEVVKEYFFCNVFNQDRISLVHEKWSCQYGAEKRILIDQRKYNVIQAGVACKYVWLSKLGCSFAGIGMELCTAVTGRQTCID